MELERLTERMAQSAEAVRALVAGADEGQWRWRPDAASWSLLEVVCHLADEEVEDFRARVDSTLHRPDRPWPPTDPMGWVEARRYNERDPGESLDRFLTERRESLAWLRGLVSPDWNLRSMAPWGSPISAGDVMASWAAHDLLHSRQIVELQWAYTTRVVVAPYGVDYAGDW
jgi:hypothetical protein